MYFEIKKNKKNEIHITFLEKLKKQKLLQGQCVNLLWCTVLAPGNLKYSLKPMNEKYKKEHFLGNKKEVNCLISYSGHILMTIRLEKETFFFTIGFKS